MHEILKVRKVLDNMGSSLGARADQRESSLSIEIKFNFNCYRTRCNQTFNKTTCYETVTYTHCNQDFKKQPVTKLLTICYETTCYQTFT